MSLNMNKDFSFQQLRTRTMYMRSESIVVHCRAVKFNRGIRKLGLMPDGVSTYLDQFRLLVGI